MQTGCLCVTSLVLLLDEAVGAEGLLVGLALERVTGRHLVGSHSEARKAYQVLPGWRARSSLPRTRLTSTAEEVEEALPYSPATWK